MNAEESFEEVQLKTIGFDGRPERPLPPHFFMLSENGHFGEPRTAKSEGELVPKSVFIRKLSLTILPHQSTIRQPPL
jgi:hypothetical protein